MKAMKTIHRMLMALAIAGIGIGSAQAHSYRPHSVLQSGNIVKLQIPETGLYCLTYDEIAALGLKPEQVRVLGYGGELLSQNFTLPHYDDVPSVAFYMYKGADNVFSSGDFILFYAVGPVTWQYKNGSYEHVRNCYADYGCYFLSDNAGEQRLIQTESNTLSQDNAYHVRFMEDYRLYEQDQVNLLDYNYGKDGGGREWYGEALELNKTLNLSKFTYPNIRTDKMLRCRVDLAVRSSDVTTIQLTAGDQTRNTMTAGIDPSDFYTMATTAVARVTTGIPDSQTPTVQLQLTNAAANPKAWLNYIELTAVRDLRMAENPFFFRYSRYEEDEPFDIFAEPKENVVYYLTGTTGSTEVWNITNPIDIRRMPTYMKGDTLCFVATSDSLEQYVAVNPTASGMRKAISLGRIANQDLHRLQDIDYVIVTPAEFYDQALRLARLHEQYDGITWAVATDEQVYNEFSSGTPDASAIRWLMKMLYDRAEENESIEHPKNLLLFGDGTFDNRQLLTTSGKSWLLTYEAENSTVETKAYATDDYFGFMEDKDGLVGAYFYDSRATMEIGVGRLPVKSAEEAEKMVTKIEKFLANNNKGRWKQELCFLADDGDHGLHVKVGDAAGEQVRIDNPDFIVNKIYLDAYVQEATASGESYPVAYNQFTNLLSNGVLLMDYSGHGSAHNICSEGFLTLADLEVMTNENQGFWMLATCSFSHFDRAEVSAGEMAVLTPNGGAIGVLSACRTVYASMNDVINRNVCDTLFAHSDPFTYPMTLGQAVSSAKNKTGNDDNKMAYVLLGDPAIRLHYPTQFEVVTTTELDTLNALSKQTVRGFIRDADGDTAKYFNGVLAVTIFDKMQRITTRDNDETDPTKKQYYTYNDYPNRLFRGEADVKNGEWEYTFMLPKDIHYNYGNGRIVYYAYDTIHGEGVGHSHDLVIGGSSNIVLQDDKGPDITLYLNTPSFKDGMTTHETPHFYARLYDDNGINTVGSGIGHDILLTIDEDAKQNYILNDYFTADRGTYQAGMVSYRMVKQSAGNHSLSFRAWDLNNNSSTATLNYTVDNEINPTIFKLITYPNPASQNSEVRFFLDTDRPDEMMYLTIRMTDLSGHPIHTAEEVEIGPDRIYTLNLNNLGIPAGLYAYRITIHTNTSGSSTISGKLIVY